MKKILNKKVQAFTLMESLLTLFIVSLFMLAPSIAYDKVKSGFERRRFYYDLERKISQTMTTCALRRVEGEMEQVGNTIVFTVEEKKEVQHILELMSVDFSSPILISENGGNSTFPKIVVQDLVLKKKITYQFHLGVGKMRKKVEKID